MADKGVFVPNWANWADQNERVTMIFISGVHGVGKSYFCDMVKRNIAINTYSASTLITEKKKSGFSSDKLIPDIDDNQQYLLDAVQELRQSEGNFILDGHFCLLNGEGVVTRIPSNTFTSLRPEAIILLTENPNIISNRRKERDGRDVSVQGIGEFQNEEKAYALEVAQGIGAKIFISKGADDFENAISFIKTL